MANEEHLKILKQGMKAWNQWRDENPNVNPSLVWAHLVGLDLTGANLSGADLSKADLHGVDLSGANLSKATLSKANLNKANLNKANLNKAILNRADLNVATLARANLTKAILVMATLDRAKLYMAHLNRAKLNRTNLSKADLTSSNLVSGCAYPGTDWVTVDAEGDGTVVVQEIGHLADLWSHSSDPNNVMTNQGGGTHDQITRFQCCMIRTSRFVKARPPCGLSLRTASELKEILEKSIGEPFERKERGRRR